LSGHRCRYRGDYARSIQAGLVHARSHIERLLDPATLAWIGAVSDLYSIDANTNVARQLRPSPGSS
jgi:hypothetical protein